MYPVDNNQSFPRHDIDPRDKGKDWCIKAGKAIWNNWAKGMPANSSFYAKRQKCSEIRDYALNKQSIAKYKKWQTGEENPDTAFFNIDQSTDAIVKTHRQKILGRLKKVAYNISATPIDAQAKGKLDDYYAMAKVKIMMRQIAEQMDPEMAANPILAKQSGEPEDLEELEMEMEFSPKFIRAKEAEQGINMVFYENEFETLIDLIDEDLVDFGAGIIKEGIDMENRVYIEFVPYASFICSYAENGNFKNLSYGAQVKQVSLSNLASFFTPEELEQIAQQFNSKNGNSSFLGSPDNLSRGYDDFKGTVLDFEIKSYDIKATEERKNKKGNIKFNLTNPANLKKADEKYSGKSYEVIYKGKWIVGTDFIYEYGLATNMKRSMNVKKLGKTDISFHVIASSFDKMCTKGITEDLIPIADEIQMTVLKLRNLNNRMIINGLAIDFSGLEGVALGGGGEKAMTPEENLDMLFQIGVIGYRSENIIADGKNQRKPIEALILDYAGQFTALWNNYQQNVNKLYEISGLNQTSDSSTVSPKMLVGVANAQNMGTNNALYYLENARRKLVEKVAKHVIQRLQAAILIEPYEGYTQTLGKQSIDFMRFEEKNLPYDYDIIIEDRPSDEAKQVLYQSMEKDIQTGVLDTSDVFTIANTYNLKDAQMILSFRAKKSRERMQQQAMQQQQMNGQIQTQAAQAAEEAKQKTMRIQSELKQAEIDLQMSWQYKIEEMKLGMQTDHNTANNATKLMQSAMGQQMAPEQAPMEQEVM
jgi:hypothetical protein